MINNNEGQTLAYIYYLLTRLSNIYIIIANLEVTRVSKLRTTNA